MACRINVAIRTLAVLSGVALAVPAAAQADSSTYDNGYGNAQDTITSLQAQGYTVELNGAAVYPLSGCKTLGVEGLHDDDVDASGRRRDPGRFDVVYVDVSCRGG